jgi:hypothetical protein
VVLRTQQLIRVSRRDTTPLRNRLQNTAVERIGQVAQLVEHRTENPGVAGSIPALSILLQSLSLFRLDSPRLAGLRMNVAQPAEMVLAFATKPKVAASQPH